MFITSIKINIEYILKIGINKWNEIVNLILKIKYIFLKKLKKTI